MVLRLIDMDHTCNEQRMGTAMRKLEALAYTCLIEDPEKPTQIRLADKLATMLEYSIEKRR